MWRKATRNLYPVPKILAYYFILFLCWLCCVALIFELILEINDVLLLVRCHHLWSLHAVIGYFCSSLFLHIVIYTLYSTFLSVLPTLPQVCQQYLYCVANEFDRLFPSVMVSPTAVCLSCGWVQVISYTVVIHSEETILSLDGIELTTQILCDAFSPSMK